MDTKILLITDTHFGVDITGEYHSSGISTYGNLRDEYRLVSEYIKKHHITHLIHLGDISCILLADKVDKMKELIDLIPCENRYFLPGNHDIFDLSDKDKKYFGYDNLPQKLIFGDTEIFLLDIELRDKLGYIPQSSIDILESLLRNSNAKYKIVCCHYPCSEQKSNICPYHLMGNRSHKSFLKNSGELRTLLEKYGVQTYISGHTHFLYQDTIHGVKHITLPAFAEDDGSGKPHLCYALLDTKDAFITYHTL